MAKKSSMTFVEDFAFYEQLWNYYASNRGKIRSRYNDLTKKFLAYNDRNENPDAFLRTPQFEALEMYVFIKEFMNNAHMFQMFDDWRNHRDKFSDVSYYTIHKRGQITLLDLGDEQNEAIFKQMKKYRESYPNYIYALTMGLGKTIEVKGDNMIDDEVVKAKAEAAEENPLMVYQFIYALLNQAILLPITADTQDTALTIFSTLNDRGLPLSDADIFKAKIYNQLAPDDKKAFIDRWKDLDEQSTDANESIQQLFYYNMFYYRALDKDTKTTTPGVRKYYAVNKFERLYKPELLDTLFVILNLWKVVNKGEELEDEAWSKNIKIRQTLDILTSYPNEYWKYPVVIYYVCYRNEENFETRFARFLNKLLMELMTKYLMIPTINAVKPDILKLNSAIVASDIPTFEFKTVDMTQLEPYIQNPNRNVVRMLLKTLAYEHQDDLLPAKWEIEHIFPQKWQTNYFPDEPDATIKEKIEHIGNKLPFEKKLNIVAGNGYFGKKKKEYIASKIVITKAMGTSDVMDWNLESITKRDIRVSDEVVKIMNRWNNEYLNTPVSEGKAGEPSEEELAQIEKFKKNGWI